MNDKITNSVYDGIYTLFQHKTTYHLDGDAFTEEIVEGIREAVNLFKSNWLGDWWVHVDHNPWLTWQELIVMSLNILNNEATRLFVRNLYLKTIPAYILKPVANLPDKGVSGAKRVNAYCGEYQEFNFLRQELGETRDTGDKYRLSGKDESCCVEGTWFDWCCFACNVLSSKNTELMCPELYEPALENNNY